MINVTGFSEEILKPNIGLPKSLGTSSCRQGNGGGYSEDRYRNLPNDHSKLPFPSSFDGSTQTEISALSITP